ncbi:MAG: (2Fe-2S) ferredoxin domain-containing protein [Marivibrio sp.]|uniref:(2Fe-2S) ferredoxin domain-containing protein n=1 Tax=Marivibrio sp. TaxID=2039719 RepID=UPI0032EEE0D5
MSEARRPDRLLVCVNPLSGSNKPCCGGDRDSERLARALETRIAERRIACRVERIHCLNKCRQGPAMRLAPGGDFLLAMTQADLPALIDRLARECGVAAEDEDRDDPFAGLYPGA